jgi:hypothetical protein
MVALGQVVPRWPWALKEVAEWGLTSKVKAWQARSCLAMVLEKMAAMSSRKAAGSASSWQVPLLERMAYMNVLHFSMAAIQAVLVEIVEWWKVA